MNPQKMMRILKKIFCLPPVLTLLITIPSFVFVFFVLTGNTVSPVIAYLSYILSAYAMVVTLRGQ
ncbi:MAG: hypothetical protein ACI4AD_12440 [Roseburia sp.]